MKVRKQIYLTDTEYFCNRSFTLSYSMITKSWISFHSYLPNFYVAENNFFYSGMNGCCDDFDFIVGIPLAESGCIFNGTAYILIPPEPNCTLQGQAEASYCELEGTAYSSIDCDLSGTAAETEIPCTRPEDIQQYSFITGYDTTDSTINQDDACDVAAYFLTLEEGHTEVINYINVEATDLLIGNTIYNGWGGYDCECIADGWYFTDESAFSNTVYHVENCVITEIVDCLATTTSTTTLFPPHCTLEGEVDILEYPETCNYNGGTAFIVPDSTTTSTSSSTTSTSTTETPETTTTTTTVDVFPFITEWTVPNGDFTFPLQPDINYNMTVDWGDGSPISTVTTWNDVDLTHTYTAGTYRIKILGKCIGIYCNYDGMIAPMLDNVIQWGYVGFETFEAAFAGCVNLISLPYGSITDAEIVNDNGFAWAFDGCENLIEIPIGLFDLCPNVASAGFEGTFYGCSLLTVIPNDLFKYNTLVSYIGFGETFVNCTGITNVPTDLFRYNTVVSEYGFQYTFQGCSNIATIPTDLFRYNTIVTNGAFQGTFAYCTLLQSIPTDLFKYNITIQDSAFEGTFAYCEIISEIPIDLFRYNTLVAKNGFGGTFKGCVSLTTVPNDIFRYNVDVSEDGFDGTFEDCSLLETVPADLFRYNVNVVRAPFPANGGFERTFYNCVKLQLNRNIFFADGEESTRFLNKDVGFSFCFARASFSGTQGEAPSLWDCDFGTETPTSITCFNGAGNSITSISNYGDIPVGWI